MIGHKITIKNKLNNKSFVINDYESLPVSIVLQSYPTDTVEIRANDIQKNGYHGSHKLPYFYGGRSLIFNGIIVAEDEQQVIDTKSIIDDVLKFKQVPNYEEDLLVTIEDLEGNKRKIDATMISATGYSRDLQENNILTFQIMLRSNSYFWLQDSAPIEITGNLGYTKSGFTLPTKVPFKFSTSYIGKQTVNLDGNYMSILRIYGSSEGRVVNPRFKNLTTGEDVIFYYTLKNENEFIEINGLTGDIKNERGHDMSLYMISSNTLHLTDGNNELVYISTLDKNKPITAVYSLYAYKYFI